MCCPLLYRVLQQSVRRPRALESLALLSMSALVASALVASAAVVSVQEHSFPIRTVFGLLVNQEGISLGVKAFPVKLENRSTSMHGSGRGVNSEGVNVAKRSYGKIAHPDRHSRQLAGVRVRWDMPVNLTVWHPDRTFLSLSNAAAPSGCDLFRCQRDSVILAFHGFSEFARIRALAASNLEGVASCSGLRR